MSRNEIVWNMFGKAKRRKDTKEVPMATSLTEQLEKYIDSSSTGTATAAMLQQQANELKQEYYQQLAQQQLPSNYGTLGATSTSTTTTGNWIPSVWTTGTPTPQPIGYPQPPQEMPDYKQLILLQIVNLITNVGPTTAKKILRKFKIGISPAEVDDIHKSMDKVLSNDDDPELDKVINDVAKEVKL